MRGRLAVDAQGHEVRLVHQALRQLGRDVPTEEERNARFGRSTELAILEFQRAHALQASGVVDDKTARALDLQGRIGLDVTGVVDVGTARVIGSSGDDREECRAVDEALPRGSGYARLSPDRGAVSDAADAPHERVPALPGSAIEDMGGTQSVLAASDPPTLWTPHEQVRVAVGLRARRMGVDKLFWKKVAAAIVRAFTITFFAGAVGLLDSLGGVTSGEADFSVALSALVALVLASLAAAIRAAQALFTEIETPSREELARRLYGANVSVTRANPRQPSLIPPDVVALLGQLVQLQRDGVLTEQEVKTQKEILLGV
jgi:hypothetical protein